MGRTPTLTELGVFSVMWSEHCSYKSSPRLAAAVADQGAVGDPRPGRERRRGRYRRRPGRRLQDGEPQPPELHRALPGRGDRRRRHPARRLHHGRAADRQPERAALRPARQPDDASASSTAWCAASAATAIASACPTVGGEINFHPAYDGNPLVNAMTVGIAPQGPHLPRRRRRHRQPGGLCRLQDRPRRHPWRHHGLAPNSPPTPRRSARPSRSATRSPRSC